MARRKPFSEVLVKMCLSDLSKVLRHIHQYRYVHCNLKPSHILISKNSFMLNNFRCCIRLPVQFAPEEKLFVDYQGLGETIYKMCSYDLDFYSADLCNWIHRLIDNNPNKRPNPLETLTQKFMLDFNNSDENRATLFAKEFLKEKLTKKESSFDEIGYSSENDKTPRKFFE